MNDSYSQFPSYVERSSRKPKLLLSFLIVFILVVIALAVLYVIGANNNHGKMSTPTEPIPTQILKKEPTMTPTPTPLQRSDLTITFLNGSGTPGAAKGISSYLKGLGYTIGTIGNADSFGYEHLTVYVTQEKSVYLEQLKKDILAQDNTASIAASIDNTIKTDAEIIVGK